MEDLYGMITNGLAVYEITFQQKIVISNNINKFQRKKYFLTLQIIYLLQQKFADCGLIKHCFSNKC